MITFVFKGEKSERPQTIYEKHLVQKNSATGYLR